MKVRPDVWLLDLATQHAPIRSEIDAAIARVVDSGQFVLGEEVERFEHEFADYCGARVAVACGSGSDALLLALMAHDIGPGDEVICPGYSFFASASCIARLGARPVFVDICGSDYNIDPECVERAAGRCSRLRAIIGVDLFGQVCDLDALLEIGRTRAVPVIEDAAQAVGGRDARGDPAGSRADASCFSLYPTKNLGCLGDGGIVTTNDVDLAERMCLLRSHGARSGYRHERVGINSRLDALQAAILRVKLGHLETWCERRRANAAFYDTALAAATIRSKGFDEEAESRLSTPRPAAAPARHVYHQYVIRVRPSQRDALRAHLLECGIDSAVYYPLGLHEQPCFRRGDSAPPALPQCEAATRETLAIPIHPAVEELDLKRVAESILGFLDSRSPSRG